MIIGILIGLLIAGLLILAANASRPSNPVETLARGVMRVVAIILILSSTGGLIGALFG